MLRTIALTALLCGLGTTTSVAGEPAWQPGGYEARIGSPYYYSVPSRVVTRDRSRAGHHGCAGNALGRYSPHHLHSGHFAHGFEVGAWSTWGWAVDPYTYHFGPGYYRYGEFGHYRFPYYTYRAPWYYPGQPVFNRDTNFAW